MSEFIQIFIGLSGLRVGWGGTCIKWLGLKAMMSELTQILYRLRFLRLLILKKKHHW